MEQLHTPVLTTEQLTTLGATGLQYRHSPDVVADVFAADPEVIRYARTPDSIHNAVAYSPLPHAKDNGPSEEEILRALNEEKIRMEKFEQDEEERKARAQRIREEIERRRKEEGK